jgi:hypothetical protein
MRKKVDQRIRTLVENGVKARQLGTRPQPAAC